MPIVLVDENLTDSVREWLKRKGFIVLSISETNLKSAGDFDIAEHAAKNGMTILTLDMDFAQIYHALYRGKLGVIVIRANPSTPVNILETLIAAQRRMNLKEIQNKLVIITKKRIRIIT